MAFDFDAPANRAGTWSSRWQRHAGSDVIPLWVADTDFRPPPAVLAALSQRIEHGILGYTVPPSELTEAIVARLARLYGWRIQPDWLVYLPGIVPGLHHAARSLTSPADHVLVPRPVYQHVKKAPEAAPRAFSELDLVLEKDRWVFDIDNVRRSLRKDTRAFFLCNPQNPAARYSRARSSSGWRKRRATPSSFPTRSTATWSSSRDAATCRLPACRPRFRAAR
jgi:bifunctional pyridoxal-dependent enzyme with beta-cystathionase and maltose regulon repressor activities